MKKLVVLILTLSLALSLCPLTAWAEEPITIEIFYSPWGAITAPSVDPYEEYLEEKYGVNFVLSPTADFSSQAMVRFASDNPPDIILANNSVLTMLYDQGVLIEDWTPYLDKLQDSMACLTENCIRFFTREGKLVCMPTNSNINNVFPFMIRKDWLKSLNMEMPGSMDEFLDYLRACTFNDPDGNGVDDTYGLGAFYSNGGGILSKLQLFFGCPGFHINDAGEVDHPILNGSYLEYLKLCNTVISEGVIEPDWYSMGNQDFKISAYGGKYGLIPKQVYHTIIETDNARGNDGVAKDMWEVMDLFQGKLQYGGLYSYARTVSYKCAQDPAKMEVICKLFNDCAYPNEDLFKVSFGLGIDQMDVRTDIDNTTFLGYSTPERKAARLKIDGSFYWGWMQATFSAPDGWQFEYMTGAEPDEVLLYFLEQNAKGASFPKYGSEGALLNFDGTLAQEVNNFVAEFEVNFMLGTNTEKDYDAFRQGWLEIGGQRMLEEAAETFKNYGLMD